MATEKPKITIYMPLEIYKVFKEFQAKTKLSMSDAGTLVFAEYFGIETPVKNSIRQCQTVGGVTLEEFKNLQQSVLELKEEVDDLKSNHEK